MQKNAVLAARLFRAAAAGLVVVSLPLATAACSSSSSSAKTTATTVSSTAIIGNGCKAISATTMRALRAGKTVTDLLKNPMFSTLSKEVAKAKVGPLFSSLHQLTIMAPTNAAFAKLSKSAKKQMKDPAYLVLTLRGHVAGMQITPKMFVKNARVPSLGGTLLTFRRAGATYEVGSVPVECGNIQAGNVTVYIIGSVLTLPK